MRCNCSELPEIFKLETHPNFEQRLDELEKENWVRFCRCTICGQHWLADEWDKYVTQFAIRLADVEGWRTLDTTALRKTYLINSRGGLTNEKCLCTGCDQRRVNGVVYCADHLFNTGARE